MRDIPASNYFLARSIVESLKSSGCTHVILSPGARSAPLAIAIAQDNRLTHTVHFDERGAAYCALGIAKRSEKPVALLCTSGTAVANYFPAVVEASQTAAPLIVMTADRPARLRGSGANQTIWQPNMFGSYTKVSVDLHAELPEKSLRASIDLALRAATESPHGVVHLNCQFDEPLVDETFNQMPEHIVSHIVKQSRADQIRDKGRIRDLIAPLLQLKSSNQQGLTILGALAPSEQNTAKSIARWLGFPIVADIQSGLRVHSLAHLLIPYHASGKWLAKNYAEVNSLVHIGGELTSRRTLDWLSKLQTGSYLQYRERAHEWNPYGHAIRHIATSIAELSPDDLDPALASNSIFESSASRRIAVQDIFSSMIPADALTEAGATATIWSQLLASRTLFIASSMPIRCFDLYADLSSERVVMSNRGASGIDGTIATAVGVAMAEGKRVSVVIGDLAMLHDLNSLALVSQSSVPLTIVLFNNQGGGIFSHLPVRQQSTFEPLFFTPHSFGFRSAAEQFGLSYAAPDTISDLRRALDDAEKIPQSTLIELRLDWKRDVELHQSIQRRIVAAQL